MQKLIQEFLKSLTGYERPLDLDSSRLLNCEVVVVITSSFLNDEDVLSFFQVNKRLRDMSQKNNVLQVRLLKIKLQKTERILNQISTGTYRRPKQPNYYDFNYNQVKFVSQPLNMNLIMASTFRKIRLNSQNKQQKQIQQKKSEQDNQNLTLTQSWPAPKPKLVKEQSEERKLVTPSYNVEELRDIVHEVKMIMLFNPKEQQKSYKLKGQPQKFTYNDQELNSSVLELTHQGQAVINTISKNMCPVVHYKRFKEAVTKVYGKTWDQDIQKKDI